MTVPSDSNIIVPTTTLQFTLYVVPQDEGLITQFFEHRNAEEKTASASR